MQTTRTALGFSLVLCLLPLERARADSPPRLESVARRNLAGLQRQRAPGPLGSKSAHTVEAVFARAKVLNKKVIRVRGKVSMHYVKVRCKDGHTCDPRRYVLHGRRADPSIALLSWRTKRRPHPGSRAVIRGRLRCEERECVLESCTH